MFSPLIKPRTGPFPTVAQMVYWDNELAMMANEWEKELNSRAKEAVIRIPVITAAQRFILYAEEAYAPTTVTRFDLCLRRFTAWVQAKYGTRWMETLGIPEYAQYRTYLTDMGKSAATVNCALYDLSAWGKWAVGESYTIKNYAKLVNKVRARRSGEDAGEVELAMRGALDYWRLSESLETDFQVAVTGLLACTGMRIGELREMRWDSSWDYHCGTLAIGVNIKDTATKKHGRLQPTPPVTRHYLQMLFAMQCQDTRFGKSTGGPWVAGTDKGHSKLTSQVGTWLKPLGICPKNLRQWFRSSLVTVLRLDPKTRGRGHDLINDLMGHMMRRTRSAYERLRDVEGTTPLMMQFSKWLLAGRPEAIHHPMTDDEDLGEGWSAVERINPGIEDETF